MILSDEVKCITCGKVFCCAKCRFNHQEKLQHTNKMIEKNNHDATTSEENYNDIVEDYKELCAICLNQPFILYPKIPDKLLIHIAKIHLPLRCNKCLQIYSSIENLIFSKCTKGNSLNKCNLQETKNLSYSKKQIFEKSEKVIQKNDNLTNSIGIQTSPYLVEIKNKKNTHILENSNDGNIICDDHINTSPTNLTPLPLWKNNTHSTEKDNVTSIQNLSCITNSSSEQKQNNSAKLWKERGIIRSTTTSTPMIPMLTKIEEKNFEIIDPCSSSSCQVSSIHSTSTESENSPIQNLQTPPSPLKSSLKRTGNLNSNNKKSVRVKMPVITTPLRHVMSKSIQRAIAEHGMYKNTEAIPKKKFELTDFGRSISVTSPLDLRTSPAIRRTRSEVIQNYEYHPFITSGSSSTSSTAIFDNFHASKTSTRNEIQLTSSKKLTTTTTTTTKKSICISSSATQPQCSLQFDKINNKNENSNTIYKTCQSIEVVTTTTGITSDSLISEDDSNIDKSKNDSLQILQFKNKEQVKIYENDHFTQQNQKLLYQEHQNQGIVSYVTPKISGLIIPIKKTISFETPSNLNSNLNCDISSDASDEVFYTPLKSSSQISLSTTNISNKSIPKTNNSKTGHQLKISKSNVEEKISSPQKNKSFENKRSQTEETKNLLEENGTARGKLWSLLTSVIRLKSFSGKESDDKKSLNENSSSLIKRCASFAGVLTKAKTSENNNFEFNNVIQAQKRKRTSTCNDLSTSQIKSISTSDGPQINFEYELSDTPPKRIRRIQGRKPIQRMRYLP